MPHPRLRAAAGALVLAAAAAPAGPAAAQGCPAFDALDAHLRAEAAADRFSGVVLAAREGRPVYAAAFGTADQERGEPVRPDTRFNIASMGKMFTAVAVAQLAREGKIDLQAPVSRYLPDYPDTAVARGVTVHHLLTHTSGMGGYFTPEFWARSRELRTVADLLPYAAREPLAFEPGTGWRYSNSAFVVLGRIVEAVSGEDYYEYLRRYVFGPAGMRDTGFYDRPGEAAAGWATPYAPERPGGPRVAAPHPVRGGPAGGGYSTAADLVRFARALRENRLLPEEYTRLVTTGKVDTPADMGGGRYAYGFGEREHRGRRVFGHNGGTRGVGANLDVFPEDGWELVVLSNYGVPAVSGVLGRVRDAALAAGSCRPRG